MENLKFTRKLITPAVAKELIQGNSHNRQIRESVLLRYIYDMINGRWKQDTGETIKIAKTGRILDGQHRLHAVVKSNVPCYFYIATGLDEDVFDVIDTGKSRNAADVFTIAEIKNSHQLSAIIAYFNLLKDNKRRGRQVNRRPTNAELLLQYYEEPLFWQNITNRTSVFYTAFAKILPGSVIGGFLAYLHKLNPDKADNFMEQLCTGLNVTNQSISLLRNKLMQDKMSPRKMPPTLKTALIIKTWNYFIKGVEVKILKYDMVQEDFPIALNC